MQGLGPQFNTRRYTYYKQIEVEKKMFGLCNDDFGVGSEGLKVEGVWSEGSN